jgi:hypothetical protein
MQDDQPVLNGGEVFDETAIKGAIQDVWLEYFIN